MESSNVVNSCNSDLNYQNTNFSQIQLGTNKIYYRYLKDIVKNAKKLYPDWVVRIYHDNSLSTKEICDLECFQSGSTFYDNVDFCNIDRLGLNFRIDLQSMIRTFWRWLPVGDQFVDVVLSRDTDSCLIQREFDAVDEWLKSNKLFHIMRGIFQCSSKCGPDQSGPDFAGLRLTFPFRTFTNFN